MRSIDHLSLISLFELLFIQIIKKIVVQLSRAVKLSSKILLHFLVYEDFIQILYQLNSLQNRNIVILLLAILHVDEKPN